MIAISEVTSGDSLEGLLVNFDEVQSPNRYFKELADFCSGDSSPLVDKKRLLEVKGQHAVLFSTALQIANLRRGHDLAISSSASVIEALRSRGRTDGKLSRVSKPASHETTEIFGSFVSSLSRRARISNQLRNMWQHGMIEGFQFDAGIPYPNANRQPNILLVDEWPLIKHDPDKPIRSAAFSGWIMATPSSADDIEQLIEKSQFIVRKRLNERAQYKN